MPTWPRPSACWVRPRANEGQTKSYTFTTSDPAGLNDTYSIVATSGGSVGTITNLVFDSATGAGSFDVTFADGVATSTVSVQVKDSDDVLSNVATIDVAVANVAPTVSLLGPATANEGQTKSYTFTTSDPAGLNDTYSIVATSGGSVGTITNLVFDSATGAGSFDVTFADGVATSTVSVQVKDSDDVLSNVATIDVAVANVAPTVSLLGPATANEGQTKSYTFTTSDPAGLNDTYASSPPAAVRSVRSRTWCSTRPREPAAST